MPSKGKGRGKLSEDDVAKHEAAFDAIDADGSGQIAVAEFKHIMEGLGFEVKDEEIDATMTKYDADKSGNMSKDEYFDMVWGTTLESARGIMKEADVSGDGKVSQSELAAAFEKLNFPNSAELAAMAMETHGGADQSLDIDELVDLLQDE